MNATAPEERRVRLRAHHFVCLQFYGGEGYSPAFVQNLTRLVEATTREPALVVGGADDVCAACPGLARDGSCIDPSAGEVEVRRLDRLAFACLGVAPGDALTLAEARERLSANSNASRVWRADGCTGCTWQEVCEEGWRGLLGESE